MIHISLLELSVTAGTGIDVVDPDSPATNALHVSPWAEKKITVDATPETPSQFFDTTFTACQFYKDL